MNNFFELLLFKVKANLISEGSRNYLSFFWWIFDPILMLAIYYLVFGIFLNYRSDDFLPFLIVGVVAWQWINRTVNNATNSINNSGMIIGKVRINKLFFPLVVIGTDFVKAVISFLVLFLLLLLLGYTFDFTILLFLLIFFVEILLIVALSFWAALIVPFLPDLTILIHSAMMALMFASGVFYSPEIIPDHLLNYFYLNPVAVILTSYRDVLIHQQIPDLYRLFVIGLSAIAFIGLSVLWERIVSNHYIRRVIH